MEKDFRMNNPVEAAEDDARVSSERLTYRWIFCSSGSCIITSSRHQVQQSRMHHKRRQGYQESLDWVQKEEMSQSLLHPTWLCHHVRISSDYLREVAHLNSDERNIILRYLDILFLCYACNFDFLSNQILLFWCRSYQLPSEDFLPCCGACHPRHRTL